MESLTKLSTTRRTIASRQKRYNTTIKKQAESFKEGIRTSKKFEMNCINKNVEQKEFLVSAKKDVPTKCRINGVSTGMVPTRVEPT